jgi:acyl-coenzyme A synthetase/AMP-(fatty) acid ligase
MNHFAPNFCLIEPDSALTLVELQVELQILLSQAPVGASLLVNANSVRTVLLGLLAASLAHDVYLVRDVSSSPFSVNWQADSNFLWVIHPNDRAPVLRLQTSGTTGHPKWVAHRITDLMQSVSAGKLSNSVWLLTYGPATFAGVQVLLAALRGGHKLVVQGASTTMSGLVHLAERFGVTHASGTPTFWRAFLRAADGADLKLKQITLGGETVDASTLEQLTLRFPRSQLRHIYATTETGVVFTVQDGCSGFPAEWLGSELPNGVRLDLSDHQTLIVSSPRMVQNYGGSGVDTGDVIEVRADRAFFKGRLDSVINIGGYKVFPEDVEAHLMTLSEVSDVRVVAQSSPITGSILTADVVAFDSNGNLEDLKYLIKQHLMTLPKHSRPVLLRFKDALSINSTHKKTRMV